MNLNALERMASGGESETLEFKKSTGNIIRAAETLCAFLNANGGTVIIGVTPEGKIVGQQISDKTQQDIANILQKFEPPAPVEITRVSIPNSNLELIVLHAALSGESLPFTFDGRAYQRIGTITTIMPQERYQQLLLDRMHSRHRWENALATGVSIDSLDQEEILRTVRLGISVGRLSESTGMNPADILDRLGLRVRSELLNAAVVLFGTRFLPDGVCRASRRGGGSVPAQRLHRATSCSP
jgi:ATP-dependent DNA helicase RecG